MSKKLSLLIACLFITTLSFAQKANIAECDQLSKRK